MMKPQIPTRDLTKLSAYLDGQLSPRQSARLATRLDQEPELRTALDELRRTRSLLRVAPRLRSPRNFTLTPAMAGLPARDPARFATTYRWVSAVASLLFVLVVAGDFLGAGMPKATAPAMSVVADVQESEAVVEMEMPAAKAVEEAAEGEVQAFALEVEPTLQVEGEADLEAADRAEKSEPPQEPGIEAPAAEAEMAEAEAPAEPTDEMPLMLAVPAPEEHAPEAEEAPVEALSPDEGGGAVAEESSEDSLPGPETTLGQSQEAEVLQEAQSRNATGLDDHPQVAPQPGGIARSGWNWFRVVEVGLAVVALGFGLLAWFNRPRG